MMRSPSENCLAPNTSTIFILSVPCTARQSIVSGQKQWECSVVRTRGGARRPPVMLTLFAASSHIRGCKQPLDCSSLWQTRRKTNKQTNEPSVWFHYLSDWSSLLASTHQLTCLYWPLCMYTHASRSMNAESMTINLFLSLKKKSSKIKFGLKMAADKWKAELTSSDLSKGTDSMKVSYILLFFALFFTMSLRNVARSWIKTKKISKVNQNLPSCEELAAAGPNMCGHWGALEPH